MLDRTEMQYCAAVVCKSQSLQCLTYYTKPHLMFTVSMWADDTHVAALSHVQLACCCPVLTLCSPAFVMPESSGNVKPHTYLPSLVHSKQNWCIGLPMWPKFLMQ